MLELTNEEGKPVSVVKSSICYITPSPTNSKLTNVCLINGFTLFVKESYDNIIKNLNPKSVKYYEN